MLLDQNGCSLSESCVPWYFKFLRKKNVKFIKKVADKYFDSFQEST